MNSQGLYQTKLTKNKMYNNQLYIYSIKIEITLN